MWQLWQWHPSVIIGCAALAVAYLALTRARQPRRVALFLSGVLVLLLALVSPLDALGDTYLFSAHMLQHELLIVIVPPLLLLGLPADIRSACRASAAFNGGMAGEAPDSLPSPPAFRALFFRLLASAGRILRHPLLSGPAGGLLAWLIGVGAIWIWHLPLFYNAALADERIHLAEHLTFLASSIIFWWPVLAPPLQSALPSASQSAAQTAPQPVPPVAPLRMPPLPRLFYLLLALAACDALGTLLAYSPPGIYPAYLHPLDTYGILPLLRGRWGITPSLDQQAGGLLMGFLGDPVYLLAAWFALKEMKHSPIPRDRR